MSESKAKNNKKYKKKKNRSYIKGAWLWPIAVAMGLIPCIVRAYYYDSGLDEFDWFPTGTGNQMDFFMFGKMVGIIVMAVIMLLLLFWRLAQDKYSMKWKKPFYLMVGYSGFVFLSFLFSPYKKWAAGGSYEVFESVWAVLGYVVIMFYTYVTVDSEADIIKVLSWASIGVGVVYVIGIFQYIGLDFFKTDFGKALMLWPDFYQYKDGLSFTFPDNWIYTTLYNVDYLALFVGAWFPVYVFLAFIDKKIWKKIIWGLFAVASPVMLKGSEASTGIIAVAAASLIIAVIILTRKKWGIFVGIGVTVLAIGAGVFFLNTSRGEDLRNELLGTYKMAEVMPLTKITTGDEEVVFEAGDEKLYLSISNGNIGVLNNDREPVQVSFAEDDPLRLIISGAGAFDGSGFKQDEQVFGEGDDIRSVRCVSVSMFGIDWIFTNELGDNTYWSFNEVGKWVKLDERKYVPVFNENTFHERGTIWNRAIYTLPQHIFIGSGANTYLMATPQDEYIYEAYSRPFGILYDVKGHSWFVTIAVEEGIVALILFLAFYIWYAIKAIIIFRKGNSKEPTTWLVLALFAGTLTYMIAAIPNDSTVNTGIVFWVMLGLGLATNGIAEEKQKKCLEDAQSN